MGGFDMGIDFDRLGENIKKFMQIPIMLIDSAHDKAVELAEDIYVLIHAPLPDNEVPDEGHVTQKDFCSNIFIAGSSSTSVKTELVDPDEEIFIPRSFSTADNSSLGHEENTSSEGVDTEVNDQCMLPEDSSIIEICDRCNSEGIISLGKTVSIKVGVILCNLEKPSDPCIPDDTISLEKTVTSEDKVILWNPGDYVKPPQPPEPTTTLNDYVSNGVNIDKMTEKIGLCSSAHSESASSKGAILLGNITTEDVAQSEFHSAFDQKEFHSANDYEKSAKHGKRNNLFNGSISHDLTAEVPNDSDDTVMTYDEIMHFVDIDLQDDQEMKYHKAQVYAVPQPKNPSFKKIFMRNMSKKLRWLKKDTSVHQVVPVGSQGTGAGVVDDWELL